MRPNAEPSLAKPLMTRHRPRAGTVQVHTVFAWRTATVPARSQHKVNAVPGLQITGLPMVTRLAILSYFPPLHTLTVQYIFLRVTVADVP